MSESYDPTRGSKQTKNKIMEVINLDAFVKNPAVSRIRFYLSNFFYKCLTLSSG